MAEAPGMPDMCRTESPIPWRERRHQVASCVVAFALRPATPSRYRRVCLRAVAARRVGKMRTRWPRRRRSRRVAPYTAGRRGLAPWSALHEASSLHCSTRLSPRFSAETYPALRCVHLCPLEWSFTKADVVDEGRRRRGRGPRSQEARQRRLGRRAMHHSPSNIRTCGVHLAGRRT